MKKYTAVLLVLSCLFATAVRAASFDCSKAEDKVSELICSDEKLSGVDGQLSGIYGELIENLPAEKQGAQKHQQQRWIHIIHELCSPNSLFDVDDQRNCLQASYKLRIRDLNIDLSDARMCKKGLKGSCSLSSMSLRHQFSPPKIVMSDNKKLCDHLAASYDMAPDIFNWQPIPLEGLHFLDAAYNHDIDPQTIEWERKNYAPNGYGEHIKIDYNNSGTATEVIEVATESHATGGRKDLYMFPDLEQFENISTFGLLATSSNHADPFAEAPDAVKKLVGGGYDHGFDLLPIKFQDKIYFISHMWAVPKSLDYVFSFEDPKTIHAECVLKPEK